MGSRFGWRLLNLAPRRRCLVVERVWLPERNRKDIVAIPQTIRQELELDFVKKIDEVLELTLETVPVVLPGPDAPSAGGEVTARA